MRTRIAVWMVVLAALGGCGEDDASTFEAGDCWFDPGSEADVVTCGTVAVPPRAGQQPRWDLAVARIDAVDGTGELPPVFWLVDGPGGRATGRMRELLDLVRPVLGVRRDIVVFDPRGVGRSEPSLACDGFAWPSVARLDEPVPSSEQRLHDTSALRSCGAAAQGRGVDLDAFDTDAMVADLDRVRRALGYDRIAVLATGQGALVAQRFEVVHPDRVELLVYDSVVPDGRYPASSRPDTLSTAIGAVFDRCAADDGCTRRFGDVEARLAATLEALDAAPIEITLPGADGATAWLTADRFVAVLFEMMRTRNGASLVPRLIDEVERGQTGLVAQRLARLAAQRDVDWLAHFAVTCNDTPASALQREASDPILGEWLQLEVERTATVCASLGLAGEDLARRPIGGDAPVLLLAGELDPVSPVDWSLEVEAARTRAYTEVFPGLSRETLSDDCPRRIAGSFLALDGQRPTSSCAEDLRFFFDPGRELELFDDWRTLAPVPRDWTSREGDVSIRYSDPNTRGSVALGFVADSSATAAIDAIREDAFGTFIGRRVSLTTEFVAQREWTTAYFGNSEADVLYVSVATDAGDAFAVAVRGPLSDVEAIFHVYRELIERFGIVAPSE